LLTPKKGTILTCCKKYLEAILS